jgi:hypothetical protein
VQYILAGETSTILTLGQKTTNTTNTTTKNENKKTKMG